MPQNVMQNGLRSKSQILDQPKEVSSSNSLEILLSREHKQYSREIEECFEGLNVSVNPSCARLSAEELPMQIIISLGTGIAGSAIYDLLKAGIKMVFRKFENAKVSLRDKENTIYSVLSDEKVKVIVVPEKEQRFSHIKHLDDLIEHLRSPEWKEMQLSQLISVKHGFAFKGEYFSEDENENVLLSPGNFKIGGGFKGEKFKYYTGDIPKEYLLKDGDLIVTMTDLSKEGDTLGFPAKVPHVDRKRFLHNQRLGLIQFKSKDLDKDFLYYLLCTSNYQKTIVNSASGSTVRHTSPTKILEYKFLMPPILQQRSIAAVLSCLDQKIDLLLKQNLILEKMAQSLFNELFVNIKGTSNIEVGELIEFNPKEKIFFQRDYLFFEMKCLSNDSMVMSNGQRRKIKSASSFREQDTLMAKITPCLENGKTAFVLDLNGEEIARGSTEFIVMRSKGRCNPFFVYCLARNENFRDFAIKSMTGTSGRQRVQVDLLKNYQVKFDETDIKNFDSLCNALFQKIKSNSRQLKILSPIRDQLLPKLISGELRVGNFYEESLFTDDLPFVTTNQALEEVKKMYPNYDEYYVTSGCLPDRRKRFDALWQQFKPHADSHFLKQYKSQFHQRSWEMYVGCVLLENGFSIKSLDEGLDFVINDDTYVECVACNNADKGKADYVPGLITGIAQDVPWRQMMLRITSVIRGKYENHYKKCFEKKWFDGNKPFIIAVNSGIFPFPQDYLGIPLIIRALFGLEFLQVNQNHQSSFSWKNNIQKGDSLVPVDYFTNDLFKEISGVIFSDGNILNHPDHIGDDCVFVNNPYASHPVSTDQFSFLKRWHADKDKLTKLY